jgi:acetate---CoA ligase (ADP-forming)
MKDNKLNNFFNPKSVAVIGASNDQNKVGYSLMYNILAGSKRAVYPVTLNEKNICGVPAFKSILDVPGEIDLAVIMVHASIVPAVLIDCGKKGVKNAIIISAGFKEIGGEGKELEDQIAKIAEENNIALLGPNCLGTIDANNDFNASFVARKPLSGSVAFLSQSGALGAAVLDWAVDEGIGFSKFISLGNEATLTEIDFLKYLAEDENTKSILLYLEQTTAGSELLRLLKQITTKKPVAVLKAGVSSYGASAIMSHTGSLAPEAKIFEAAMKQSGVMIISSLSEFFNVTKLFSFDICTNPPVQNLVIVTNGGGPSVIAADEVGLSKSLSLVSLSSETKEKLKKVLPEMASVRNPIDVIGDATLERYRSVLDILCDVEEVDGIIVMLTPQKMTDIKSVAELLSKYKKRKKIFPLFMGGPSVKEGNKFLTDFHMMHFHFSRDIVEALDILANSATSPRLLRKSPSPCEGEGKKEETSLHQMPFLEMAKIFSEFNLNIAGKFINKKEELENTLRELGDGPYAMKAISGEAVHKTEAGAVRLNISNFEEASQVWEELWTSPIFGCSKMEGVLVQKMESAKNREVIIGMKRDATFGSTILFGLGGILAEAIKDTTLRIAPIEKPEALKMMQEIKGIKILHGLRGQPSVNFDLLAEIIVNLSNLSLAHPEIKEIDLNPVMATESSAIIVDARVMI